MGAALIADLLSCAPEATQVKVVVGMMTGWHFDLDFQAFI